MVEPPQVLRHFPELMTSPVTIVVPLNYKSSIVCIKEVNHQVFANINLNLEAKTAQEQTYRGSKGQLNGVRLQPTMSMSDLVNHIGHCISEQKPSWNVPFFENMSGGDDPKEMLENVSQILLSDTHVTTASDEKTLMSRVNSLCSLLQDSSSAQADRAEEESIIVGANEGALPSENLEVGNKNDVRARAGASCSIDKLKASNFPALLLRIGQWEYVSEHEGDLVANHELVWEFLDGGLKNEIEIQWADIIALKANFPDNGPAV